MGRLIEHCHLYPGATTQPPLRRRYSTTRHNTPAFPVIVRLLHHAKQQAPWHKIHGLDTLYSLCSYANKTYIGTTLTPEQQQSKNSESATNTLASTHDDPWRHCSFSAQEERSGLVWSGLQGCLHSARTSALLFPAVHTSQSYDTCSTRYTPAPCFV
jgi:hypothetical protein